MNKLPALDKRILAALEDGLPVSREPFGELADTIGLDTKELLERIRALKGRGVIRRFAVSLNHRGVGYTANAMAVWNVPDEDVERVGPIMAEFPEVTHCYHRKTASSWKYNMFTMIHGKDEGFCYKKAEEISGRTGVEDYKLLFSKEELKKTSTPFLETLFTTI